MSKLLIEEPPLQVLPQLASLIGLNEAIVLQQLHYWLIKSGHEKDGRRWVYNTYEGWQEQFPFWSVSTIRRAFDYLRKYGYVTATSEYNKIPADNTLWFSINYDQVDNIPVTPVVASAQNEQRSVQNEQTARSIWTDGALNMSRAIPETTTETTPVDKPQRGKKKDTSDPPHPNTKPILDAYIECLGYTPTKAMIGRDSKAAKDMAQRGFTPDDVHRAYPVIKSDSFWKHKTVSLNKVLETLLETNLTIRRNGGGDGQAGSTNEPTDAEYDRLKELNGQAKRDPSKEGEYDAYLRHINQKYFGVRSVQG